MKVAFIVRSLKNSGPIIITKFLTDYLLKSGISCKVYYFKDIHEIQFNCPVKKIEFNSFEQELNEYDIVHSHNLFPDLYVWRNRKHIKSKCITTKHENTYISLKSTYNIFIAAIVTPIYHYILKTFDLMVCMSKTMLDYYKKSMHLDKLAYVYNGIPLEIYSSNLSVDVMDIHLIHEFKQSRLLVATICNLNKIKGISQLIYMLKDNKNICLIVIGEGKEKEKLGRLALKLNVVEQVLFLGYRFQAMKYLKYVDVFALCSYSEGFPVAIMEAGIFKVPVVCSNIKIFNEIYDDSEVVFFKLNDIQSLSIAIEYAYKRRDQLANNLYHKIMANYSVDKMGEGYLALYKHLIKGNQIV